MKWVVWFVRDYISRHENPWSRALHVVGVPLAPFGCLYLLIRGRYPAAGAAFVVGYALQWLGHHLEGNEVGEWILIKNIAGRLMRKKGDERVEADPGHGLDRLPGAAPGGDAG